jgi:hypothetical protein
MGIEQYEKAVELLQEVVRISQTTLGSTHPYRLQSESLLSQCRSILCDNGSFQFDISITPASGSKDSLRVVAEDNVENPTTASGFKDSSDVVTKGGSGPAMDPKRKRDIVLGFFRKGRF